MHVTSVLLSISSDADPRSAVINAFPFGASIENNPDLHWLEVLEEKASIGIEEVRGFVAGISHAPYAMPLQYAIVLRAELLTTEAQNALLKFLEEPPSKTQIILVTHLPQSLLGTVRSRCVVIKVGQDTPTSLGEKLDFPKSIAAAIDEAEKIGKTREDAVQFCVDTLASLRSALFAHPSVEIVQGIQTFRIALRRIKRNVNSRQALEAAFFSLLANA